ncbi:DUF1257 domain-containing protein [Cyanobacteria bacterium FACHB-DQ100]|uniref:DUF1257 domain-containing protein n=1 Tax=Leptolyngbya sp. DQ-M1 TaxID=2933920 RepID=UPI0019CAA796|nr:DUF1257 domain-containing protein [Cyanobacteria bacterium FACHB-DQ100]
MSHFTTIKVEIKDGEVLHQALRELRYKVEQNALVRGYQGNKIQADYVIRRSNGYDLGFRREGDEYVLIADFWGARINQTQFINEVQQKYAHKQLQRTAAEQGYTIEAEEVLEDGTVRVVVGRWI